MTQLLWDQVGSREFETGLDRGVLYCTDGRIVPWNGLRSVTEKVARDTEVVYYDGKKINQLISGGEFSGVLKAVTYPDEFDSLSGMGDIRPGVRIYEQRPQMFNLSYRTLIGNDIDQDAGYKIHILYNAFAVPQDNTFNSVSDQGKMLEFGWDIYTIPEEIPGYYPTSHISVSTLDTDPWMIEDLEAMLYGSDGSDPELLPLSEMLVFLREWDHITITDNGDGTWTAYDRRSAYINVISADEFEIVDANATYLDADTYEISDL